MNVTSPNSSPMRLPWPTWLRRLWPRAQPGKSPRLLDARLSLIKQQPVAQVDERYLSFSLDISVVAGGFWWEGTMASRRGLGRLRIPPLDLTSPKLDKLTQALAPA